MQVKYLVLSLSLFLVTACNKTSSQKVEKQVSTAPMATQKGGATSGEDEPKKEVRQLKMKDCLSEYADMASLTDVNGEIVVVMDLKMISYNESSRAHACNLPEEYNEGDMVVFSGVIKESPPGVRLAGTPFKLSSIRKK